MKMILWDLTQRLSFRDVFLPAIAGRSAGPESIAPAVVMDSGQSKIHVDSLVSKYHFQP